MAKKHTVFMALVMTALALSIAPSAAFAADDPTITGSLTGSTKFKIGLEYATTTEVPYKGIYVDWYTEPGSVKVTGAYKEYTWNTETFDWDLVESHATTVTEWSAPVYVGDVMNVSSIGQPSINYCFDLVDETLWSEYDNLQAIKAENANVYPVTPTSIEGRQPEMYETIWDSLLEDAIRPSIATKVESLATTSSETSGTLSIPFVKLVVNP